MTAHLTKPIRATHFMVLAFLMTIGTQVIANIGVGDVLYCTSDGGAFAGNETDWKVSRWSEQKFKFKVESSDSLIFGDGGYFANQNMKIVFLRGNIMEANRGNVSLTIRSDLRFVYSEGNLFSAGILTGTCDKF